MRLRITLGLSGDAGAADLLAAPEGGGFVGSMSKIAGSNPSWRIFCFTPPRGTPIFSILKNWSEKRVSKQEQGGRACSELGTASRSQQHKNENENSKNGKKGISNAFDRQHTLLHVPVDGLENTRNYSD